MSFLAATACSGQRVVLPIKPSPDRLVCEARGARPAIPPEYVIDWAAVSTVAEARAEHEKYVATIRDREGRITGYIVTIEGRLFTCGNNMQWNREFFEGLPDK